MAKKERKACRVVWFDEKGKHIPVKRVKAIITPQSFRNVRALACKRGRIEFSTPRLGNVVAKSMTQKEQAKVVPKPRRRK